MERGLCSSALQALSYLNCGLVWGFGHLHAWGTFDQNEATSLRCAGTSLMAMASLLLLSQGHVGILLQVTSRQSGE